MTPGPERLILAAVEATLKLAAIAREFQLSRAQVDGVVAASKQRRRYLLAADGWKIEQEKGIFGHGGRGAFVASVERRWETNFYPITTNYATFATSSSRRE